MPSLIANNQSFVFNGTVGHDSSALTLGSDEPSSSLTNCTINGGAADWGLKMPGNYWSCFHGGVIAGGAERALDIVRGVGARFTGVSFLNGGFRRPTTSRFSLSKTCDIGIKGGATEVAFTDCKMTDLLIGDFSIYDHDKTLPGTVVTLGWGCRHPNPDKPIIVRCLNGRVVVAPGVKAVVLNVPAFAVAIYFWFCRRFGDTRKPPVTVPALEPAIA